MEIQNPYGRTLPAPSRREILRYLKSAEPTAQANELIDRATLLAAPVLAPAVCFEELAVDRVGDTLFIGSIQTNSRDLCRYFEGCDRAVVFAATLGTAFERLVQRESKRSPATALALDALGDERIEALCDDLCAALAARFEGDGYLCKPRFSAGYGDAPLALQQEIFALLSCPKTIGVCLTDSLLMCPQKSVTAFVGKKRK